MRAQAQHDEVGVQAVETVARVDVVVGPAALVTDELHDFVLALARNLRRNEAESKPSQI